MKRIHSIHNKTKEIDINEQPFNENNVLLMEADLNKIFESVHIDYKFKDINMFRTAFVHRSYSLMKNNDFDTGNMKCPKGCIPLQATNLERHEWLGDSLLDFIITDYIYRKYPDQNEGWCSKMKVKFVNGKQCGHLSKCLGFDKFVMISKQLDDIDSRNNYKIQEDVFEAFIGALYLDSSRDIDVVKRFIINVIEEHIDMVELIMKNTNYKDMLNIYMMDNFNDSPKYFEVNVVQKNMMKIFTYVVKNRDDEILGSSTGHTKKEAENNCSYEALKNFGINV